MIWNKSKQPADPQQDAAAALLPEACLAVFRDQRRAHLLAKRTGHGAVARQRVLVQNDLPVLAAGIRAFARQTGKLVYIIKCTYFITHPLFQRQPTFR